MTNQENNQNTTVKLVTEIVPILCFFLFYKLKGMIYGTGALVVATIIGTYIRYRLEKKISTMSIFSCVILVIFGGITVYTQDSSFIKLKVTFINLIFAATLFVGVMRKKAFAKYIYGGMIELSESQWLKISLRWAFFFLFLALLNELIWRNLSESFWIKFKVFGLFPITIVFAAMQIPRDKFKQ